MFHKIFFFKFQGENKHLTLNVTYFSCIYISVRLTHEWVREEIVRFLENHDYTLCTHTRDFVPTARGKVVVCSLYIILMFHHCSTECSLIISTRQGCSFYIIQMFHHCSTECSLIMSMRQVCSLYRVFCIIYLYFVLT